MVDATRVYPALRRAEVNLLYLGMPTMLFAVQQWWARSPASERGHVIVGWTRDIKGVLA